MIGGEEFKNRRLKSGNAACPIISLLKVQK